MRSVRHRVRARDRHRRAQGRQGSRRGDLRRAQLHDRVPEGDSRDRRRRCAWAGCSTAWRRIWRTHGERGFVRSDAPEASEDEIVAELKEIGRRDPGQLPPRRLGGGDPLLHGMRAEGGRRGGQLHAGVHRQQSRNGSGASARRTCRSSATTSRRSWARPSSTASFPACSGRAASATTAPTSSTPAAIPTS